MYIYIFPASTQLKENSEKLQNIQILFICDRLNF